MKHSKLLYTVALALAPQFCFAQQQALLSPVDELVSTTGVSSYEGLTPKANATFESVGALHPDDANTPAPTVAVVADMVAATYKPWHEGLDRWLDLTSFDYGNRYRSVFASSGAHGFSQGQQKLAATGKFKFDAEGKYGIGFHLSSGRYFNWAYADYIGGGQHDFVNKLEANSSPLALFILGQPGSFPTGFFNSGGGQVYLRELYLTAEPIKGVEAQFGGLGIEHGVNTEATSYDDDGYMVGERIIVKRPKQLFLSEIVYTNGYLGDMYTPNFFARGKDLAKSNYQQILGRKDFGKRLAVSADYTVTTPEGFSTKLNTTREAVYADTHETRVVGSVRFEAYQRLTTINTVANGATQSFTFAGANGYALTLTRSIRKRFSVDVGLANIDNRYFVYLGQNTVASIYSLSTNGDQFSQGERYFVRPTIPLTRYMSLTGYYNHIFNYKQDPIGQVWNAQALTGGVVVDIKRLLFPGEGAK